MDVSRFKWSCRARVVRDRFRTAGPQFFPSSSIKNQITRLVVTRAAVLRGTNSGLADEYHKLATLGAVDPGVYAAVLRSARGPVRVSRLDDLMRGQSDAA